MDKSVKNVLFVGVGGQGIILASEILSEVAMNAGYDVKKSEVHGMSQRGGVVSSHVRFGEKVYSPLIDEGNADILPAFEEVEGLRWCNFVKEDGLLIVNRQKIIPPNLQGSDDEYPDDAIDRIKGKVKNLLPVDAYQMALSLGNIRLVNVLMLGVMSGLLPIPEEIWREVIERRVPKGYTQLNLDAFSKAREIRSNS